MLLAAAPLNVPAVAVEVDDMVTAEEQKYLATADAPKFAMVIYQKEYIDPGVDRDAVRTADTDALQLSALLERAGFGPRILANKTRDEILAEVNWLMTGPVKQEKNRGIRPVVFIYFAGHGYQIGGADYLATKEFDRKRPVDTGLSVLELVNLVAHDANLLLFSDACRTTVTAEQQLSGESMDDPRPLPKGADERLDTGRGPRRYLISYAAERNAVSYGSGVGKLEGSPYTAALMQELFASGRELRSALPWVRILLEPLPGGQAPIIDDGSAVPPEYYLMATSATDEASYRKWLDTMRSGDQKQVDRFIEAAASSRYLRAAVLYRQDHATK